MNLGEFLKHYKISLRKFAKSAGITKDQANNASASRSIGLIAALKIHQATYGMVSPFELLNEETVEREGLKDYLLLSSKGK